MNTEKSVIYLLSENKKLFLKYSDENNNSPLEFNSEYGIVGKVIQQKKSQKVLDHSTNEDVNFIVDLQTSLPTYNILIKDQ